MGTRSEAMKRAMRKYSKGKGKIAEKRYHQSDKGKMSLKKAQRKYFRTLKGKLALRRYTQSNKGRLKRWASLRRARKKYENKLRLQRLLISY